MPQLTIVIPACPGCCKFCHDFFGDTMESVVSMVVNCSGCYTIDVGSGAFDIKVSWTGVNGMASPAWDGSQWIVSVGTLTVLVYGSSDGTCATLTDTKTATLFLAVNCSGANVMVATINATVTFGIVPVAFTVFQSTVGTTFGTPMPSTLILAGCGGDGNVPPFIVHAGYGGTLTLAQP